MSDVIRDKTNAEVVSELRSSAADERLAAYTRHLLTMAAFRIEALQQRLDMLSHRAGWVHPDDFRRLRQEAFDLGSCPNGPDEDGTYPCDPQVTYGGGWAECSVCGRGGVWPASESNQERRPE